MGKEEMRGEERREEGKRGESYFSAAGQEPLLQKTFNTDAETAAFQKKNITQKCTHTHRHTKQLLIFLALVDKEKWS